MARVCWLGLQSIAGALVLVSLLAPRELRAAENNSLTAAAKTISAGELKRHVEVLADDSFEGREGGSRGGRAAGGYLAAELKKLGLRGAGDQSSYFQAFDGGQRNILALLEGSDPELKKQYVIIGAHYDHVGYGSRTNSFGPTGYIHNGADDNASGVSGLLEIMQAFTSLPQHPRRSVIFALWDGEEKGLLGSKRWLSNPTVPAKSVVLYINLDMIGRLRKSYVEVYGTRTSQGLRVLSSRQNEGLNLVLDFTWEMKENSDHYSFYERGIPSMMFHTGLHDNYHRPSDDAHLINNDGIEQVSQLVFKVAHAAADSDRGFKFRNESRREDPAGRRSFEKSLAPPAPRLGVEWKVAQAGDRGVVLAKVISGQPAQRAGLKAGDRLIKFGEVEVTGATPLRTLVLTANSPVEFTVERAAQAEPLKVIVALHGSPVRLGIAWRDDPAEPGTVMLTQVVHGSTAQRAGLKERDRIYEIGGQTFANSEEFRKLATSLPSPIDVLAERYGVLRRYSMEVEEISNDQ